MDDPVGDRQAAWRPLLTPMQRIQLAKKVRHLAATQPNLSTYARAELRRRAYTLVGFNLFEAKRRKKKEGDSSPS